MKDSYSGRSDIIRWVFSLSFFALIFQTARLQLFDDSYRQIAAQTTINKKIIEPSRGIFYDRNGLVLTNNEPIYDVMCTRNLVQAMDTAFFCYLLEIEPHTFVENLNKDFRSRLFSRSIPYVFIKNLDQERYQKFHEHLYNFPGFDIRVRNLREYPEASGSNVVGYVSEVSQAQIVAAQGNYSPGDFIGSRGLEKQYDDIIRGKNGLQLILKDNRGKEVSPYEGGLLDTAATSGRDIITSLDIELQNFGEEIMKNKNGSIVAIEPKTGEILAMISSPNFDPNMLSVSANRGVFFDSLNQDPNKPFLDRTVSAKYPPGSIFKTVVALIALQEGVFRASKGMVCNGSYTFANQTWGCRAHPYPANMAVALRYSCNTYFYQVFRSIIDQYGYRNPQKGLDQLNQYLYKFGMGKKLNIDYPFEQSGNVPTSRYYNGQYGSNGWKSPTIVSNAIGQGELELTTVQMANLAAIIANYGSYRVPHLIKSFVGDNQEIPLRFRIDNSVGIDSLHFNTVRGGMELAGRSAGFPGVMVAGKTGTSQNTVGTKKDHSVFFAFAPSHDPQIAIAVYVENAGFGSTVAAPVASFMIEKYLNRQIANNRIPKLNFLRNIRTSIEPESQELKDPTF